VTLVLHSGGNQQRIDCGRDAWRKGRVTFGVAEERPAAARGAWTSDDTFTAKICFYETPFINTLRLSFKGNEVRLVSEANVGFGSMRESALVGKSE
jgi:hypothetical protein